MAQYFTAHGILLETCVYMFVIILYNTFLDSVASKLESNSNLLTFDNSAFLLELSMETHLLSRHGLFILFDNIQLLLWSRWDVFGANDRNLFRKVQLITLSSSFA